MTTLFLFLAGMAALTLGAEMLVRGASKLALSLGISPLVVGLTVVAFGTSAPEMAVGSGAAYAGHTAVAVGNIIGSNVFNVLFILGLSALITPLAVHAQVVRQEVPMMIGMTLVFVLFAIDGVIGFGEAAVLFVLLLGYTAFLIWQSRRETRATAEEFAGEMPPSGGWDRHWSVQLALVVVGLTLLLLGSDWLVDASVTVARALGVSDLVIALTLVAAGTSLPEVAASIMAALRGERDIAVGNVVGSNVFNLLGCGGLAGLLAPDGLVVPEAALRVDLWVMFATMLACLPVFIFRHEISRWQGLLLLLWYLIYTAYLVLLSMQHPGLAVFGLLVFWGLLPLTAAGLLWMLLKRQGRVPG